MRTFSRGSALATTLAITCVFASFTARATTAVTEEVSEVVHFSDLNLDNPGDVRRLYVRLEGAASYVCGDPDTHSLTEVAQWRECRDQALAKAVAGVNRPQLTALYASHHEGAHV